MSFFESFEHFEHSEDFDQSLNHATPPQKVFEVRKKQARQRGGGYYHKGGGGSALSFFELYGCVKRAVGITAQAEVDDR